LQRFFSCPSIAGIFALSSGINFRFSGNDFRFWNSFPFWKKPPFDFDDATSAISKQLRSPRARLQNISASYISTSVKGISEDEGNASRKGTSSRTSRIEVMARARGRTKSVIAKFRDRPVHQGSDGIRTAGLTSDGFA
jgi:hypothetical protein